MSAEQPPGGIGEGRKGRKGDQREGGRGWLREGAGGPINTININGRVQHGREESILLLRINQ